MTEDANVPIGRPSGATVLAVGAICLLLVLSIADLAAPIADGANHVFTIKQLWDTGSFAKLHHQLGTQLVAESLFALTGEPTFVGAFEGELCGALLLLLLASELRPGQYRMHEATLLVVTLAITIDLFAYAEARWSGALLFVAAFLALRAALQERRIGWHAVAIAAALGGLRHEYMLIAIPHVVVALSLPIMADAPTRRSCVTAVAGWAVFLLAFQLPLAVPMRDAVVNAAVLSVLAACGWWVIRALANVRWNDAVGVALFSGITSFAAVWLGAVRPAQHSESATFAVGFGLAICLLVHFAHEGERDDASALTRATSAIVLGAFTIIALLEPSFKERRRDALLDRFRAAIITLRELDGRGVDTDAALHVRLLQDHVPAHASIGFWGESAGAIDFVRNRVVDIAWAPKSARRATDFLVPLTPRSLAKLQYVIVEDLPPPPVFDPWAPQLGAKPDTRLRYVSPLTAVESQLEPVAVAGAAKLYRVRAAR